MNYFFLLLRSDLYYTLHPIAVEVVHPEPHQVLLFHHVLSEREVEEVARLAGNKMKQSATGRYWDKICCLNTKLFSVSAGVRGV